MMTPPKRPMRPMPGRTGPAPKPMGPMRPAGPQVSPPMVAGGPPGSLVPGVPRQYAKGGKVSPAMKAKAKVAKKGTMRKAPSRSR